MSLQSFWARKVEKARMETFTRKDWPDGCPPADAADANAVVYYVVKETPCIPGDFLSQAERGRAKGADPCCRCGLSVWTDEADARHLAELHPRLGTLIAQSQLQPEHGKLKKTFNPKRSHHTWWPPDGFPRHTIFVVIGSV